MRAARPQAVPLRAARARLRLLQLGAALALVGLLIAGGVWRGEAPAAEQPRVGGTYREAVAAEALAIRPLAPRQAPRDPDLAALLFRGLARVDERGAIHPELAERWDISADGRAYRFHLRPDLRWDDGQALTADDVLFSTQRAASASRREGQPTIWADVTVQAAGPEVVEFSLREPLGAFLEHAALPIVAAHAPPTTDLPLPAGAPGPASNGPYRLGESRPAAVVLERNPHYAGPPPTLDRLEFHLLPSREAALQALLAGQVDGLAGLTPAEQSLLSRSEQLRFYDLTERGKQGELILNTQRGVFRERAVRQAVTHAIDRAALIEGVLQGAAEPALGPLPPSSWAFDPDAPRPGYDPRAAAALLDGAGWQADPTDAARRRAGETLAISLLTSNIPTRLREAAEVARQLRLAGFEVAIRALPLETLSRDHLASGDFDAVLIGRWLAETDPDQFALWHSTQVRGVGSNYGGASAPRLDHWLEVGRRQVTPEERLEAYRRFQAAWADEQPSVLLYHPRAAFALSRDLLGARSGPFPDASWRLRQLPAWYRQAEPGLPWLTRPPAR